MVSLLLHYTLLMGRIVYPIALQMEDGIHVMLEQGMIIIFLCFYVNLLLGKTDYYSMLIVLICYYTNILSLICIVQMPLNI